jgi:biopolymer transport protein ExbB
MPLLAASFQSVYHFFAQGGFFMVLLLGCSVIAVAIILLRGLALRRELVLPERVEHEINTLDADGVDACRKLRGLVDGQDAALARIVQVGLDHLGWTKSENMEAVQTRARHEIVLLESGLFVLEVIVGIAPLLGLLGAVAGLVTVFATLGASANVSDPRGIAKGISEALSTTIVGLSIAIPCLIAHTYFTKKIETMAAEMESLAAALLSKCYEQKKGRSTARVTPSAGSSAVEGAQPRKKEQGSRP